MHLKKRLIASLITISMVGAVIYGSTKEIGGLDENRGRFSWLNGKETIYIYYSDERMSDYISAASVSFGEEMNARVIPVLTSGSEYLEAINMASVSDVQTPDLFLLSNEALEKAYLSGLACEVIDGDGILNENNYPSSALNAVTYKGKYIGYPLSFDTSALVYNETYLEAWARSQAALELESLTANESDNVIYEEDVETSDEVYADTSEEYEEKKTFSSQIPGFNEMDDEEKLNSLAEQYLLNGIPDTVDDILNIADTFDAPEGLDGIMEWDVSDIFYNYWVVGNYMSVGGPCGDDNSIIDINNDNVINCLKTYAGLNQFFSMETATISYESVVDDFIQGKTFFTIGTSDVVKTLEAAKDNGDFNFEYGIAQMPSINNELDSCSMSVTNTLVVNGYSEHKELADKLAAYLSKDMAGDLYTKTQKIPAYKNVSYEFDALGIFALEYADSISLPKLLETENYWMQVETLFAKIWDGNDVNKAVSDLQEQILLQIKE